MVGYNSAGWLTNCYTTGSVAGTSSVGGFVGHVESGSLLNCYSTCFLSGSSRFGGLVGYNGSGLLFNCYSSGMVIGGTYSYGGLVGYNSGGTVTNCFWDMQTSGRTSSDGGTGKTTALMQTLATFLDVGWDFRDESANGLAETWQMPVEGGYPVLSLFHGYTPAPWQAAAALRNPMRSPRLPTLPRYVINHGHAISWIATSICLRRSGLCPSVPVFFGPVPDATAILSSI